MSEKQTDTPKTMTEAIFNALTLGVEPGCERPNYFLYQGSLCTINCKRSPAGKEDFVVRGVERNEDGDPYLEERLNEVNPEDLTVLVGQSVDSFLGLNPAATKRYRMFVETDFDFSLSFRGDIFTDYHIELSFDEVSELDEIILQGPFGAPVAPEHHWEWDDALAAIRANPDQDFSNLGGNRGVRWSVSTPLLKETP